MGDCVQAYWRKPEPDMIGNSNSQFALNRENAGQFAAVGAGPNVSLVVHADQLRGDSDLLVFSPNTAFQNVVAPSSAPISRMLLLVRL